MKEVPATNPVSLQYLIERESGEAIGKWSEYKERDNNTETKEADREVVHWQEQLWPSTEKRELNEIIIKMSEKHHVINGDYHKELPPSPRVSMFTDSC